MKSDQIAATADRLTDWRQVACDLIEAEQKSRSRLAERLHGELQQLLTVALMRTWAAKRLASQEEMLAVLAEVEAVIRESIEETRTLTLDLSPPILRHSAFCKAMEWIAERLAELYGMKVELAIHPEVESSAPGIKSFLFDAVRSILLDRNTTAGHQTAQLAVARLNADIEVAISFPPRNGSPPRAEVERNDRAVPLNAQQIADRVAVLQGVLFSQATPDGGERVVLRIPAASCSTTAEHPSGGAAPNPAVNGRVEEVEPTAGVIRVLLAEDHHMVREGLARLINGESDLRVVGEAADGDRAVELAAQLDPDVVVLDVNMPVRTGPEAARRIRESSPHVKIVGLSEYGDRFTKRAMRDAGASAYLCKDAASEELCRAIRNAVNGNGHGAKRSARKNSAPRG